MSGANGLHDRIALGDETDGIGGDGLGSLVLLVLREGGCAPGGQQNIDPDVQDQRQCKAAENHHGLFSCQHQALTILHICLPQPAQHLGIDLINGSKTDLEFHRLMNRRRAKAPAGPQLPAA